MKILLLLLLGVSIAACSGSGRPSGKAPATKIEPVKDMIHGVEVVDNYRWLEGDTTEPAKPQKVTPDVTAWTDAQNALHARGARSSAGPEGRSRIDCGR